MQRILTAQQKINTHFIHFKSKSLILLPNLIPLQQTEKTNTSFQITSTFGFIQSIDHVRFFSVMVFTGIYKISHQLGYRFFLKLQHGGQWCKCRISQAKPPRELNHDFFTGLIAISSNQKSDFAIQFSIYIGTPVHILRQSIEPERQKRGGPVSIPFY